MCVGFWTLEHPEYALILCNNRDEYLARPTAPAHWHSFGPVNSDNSGAEEGSVLSGRDLLAGGTWAGLSRTGRLALLTNITEPLRKYASSRGDLTHSFLLPKAPAPTLEAEIDAFLDENRDRAYAGFNMLILTPAVPPPGDLGPHALTFDGAFITNSGGGGKISARMLSDSERRCAGMSNGVDHLGANEWPKVKRGTHALHDMLNSLPQNATEAEIVEQLFALLTWKNQPAPVANRSELRNTIHVEPIPVPLSDTPSSATQSSEGTISDKPGHPPPQPANNYYGTRLSTVILIRRDGSVVFIERDIWALDGRGGVVRRDFGHDRVFRFQIPTGAPRTDET